MRSVYADRDITAIPGCVRGERVGCVDTRTALRANP